MKFSYRNLLRRAAFVAACATVTYSASAQKRIENQLPGADYVHHGKSATVGSAMLPSDVHYKITDAQAVFSRYLPLTADDALKFSREDRPDGSITVQRFSQYYKNIRIAHGTYTLTAKDGEVKSINGDFYNTSAGLNTAPSITEAAALQKTLAHIGADKYAWQDANMETRIKRQKKDQLASYMPTGELEFVEDFSSTNPDGVLHLAWKFDVYALSPLSRKLYYIDAATGEVLLEDAVLKHVAATGSSLYSGTVSFETNLTGTSYFLYDYTRGNGVLTYSLNHSSNLSSSIDITNTTTTWPSQVGIDAHWGAEKVYDYWKNVMNRMSYDGNNGIIESYVNYSTNYDNAFWDGAEMNYGDGSGIANGGLSALVSLDVCAHEIGHGVCQHTCNLVYSRESGGMNEGFSDIWGAVIENYADPHETDAVAKNHWLVGEEIGADPLRSMANPKLYGQPDTYLGLYWAAATASCSPNNNNDQCGVHTNSGVLNKWFYLLSDGGIGTNDIGNAYQVPGITIAKAAKIAYNTELVLANNANYAACRTASINAATTLYGACSMEVEGVVRAWYAVGVGTNYVPCTPQISFAAATTTVTENASSTACPASHTVNIPVTLNGPALSGGNPVVTVSVTGGSLVSGVDYVLTTPTLTFTVGGPVTQNAVLTVFDNGSVDTNRSVDLAFTLVANGSNATAANVFTTQRIYIASDDKVPNIGGIEQHNVNTSNATGNLSSPFFSSAAQARSQFILTAAELTAAGLRANVPITSVAFNVTQKLSTQAFNGYTIKMGPTTVNDFGNTTAFVSGLTTVYTGNYTTNTSWNTFTLSTGITWDGVSNIAFEICFSNTAAGSGNDKIAAYNAGNSLTAYNSSTANASGGCALAYNNNNKSTAKPVVRFMQTVPPAAIAATAGEARSWDVRTAQKVYFNDGTTGELIAAVVNPSADLGCTIATVSKQGTGFAPASFGSVNRTIKEFTIVPAQNGDTTAYNGTVYFQNAELGGSAAFGLYLVKTTSVNDAGMIPANTVILTPQLVNGQNYTGFTGSFKGFGRYFLIDGPISLGISHTAAASNGDYIRVNGNPFHDEIGLSWQMVKEEKVQVSLSDITGKIVYSSGMSLSAGQHGATFNTGIADLPAGQYILRAIGAGIVFTQQLLKN